MCCTENENILIAILEELIQEGSISKGRAVKKLKDTYLPIINQYRKIWADMRIDEGSLPESIWKNFTDTLKKSIKFVAHHSRLLGATEKLNLLAKKWDNGSDNHSHVFFFCCIDDDVNMDENDGTYTRMFYEEAPPDHRLICIFLPRKNNYAALDFYEVLHEVGHYIGGRGRIGRIEAYRNAVAAELCNQVYLRLMQKALGGEEVQEIRGGIEEIVYFNSEIRCLSFDTRRNVTEAYETLRRDLEQKYIHVCELNQDGLSDSEKAALDNGYLTFVTPVTLLALHDMNLEIYFNSELPHIQDVLESLRNEIRDETKNPRWIESCKNHFKEPSADLFVIELAKLKYYRYIRFVLNSAYNTWSTLENNGRRTSFFQFFLNSDLLPKIIGVLSSVYKLDEDRITEGDFSLRKRLLRWSYYFWNRDKADAFDYACDLIGQLLLKYSETKEMMGADDEQGNLRLMLQICNPIYRVSDYLDTIREDFWKYPEDENGSGEISNAERRAMRGIIKPLIEPNLWYKLKNGIIRCINSLLNARSSRDDI